jgi:L-ascorbate metabolism protein UlaG (beta-lactamase superfamily)
MRSRLCVIATVALFSLALFAARSYSLDMNAAPDHSHPRLEPASWPDNSLTIANLGHAALLMNFFGTRVLSDPTLFSRVGMSIDSILTIGPKRFVDPPLTPAQLQHIDVILITHAHMDHLDLPSLEALPKTAVVVACEKCAKLIAPLGFNDVRELKWGETTIVKGITIRAMGARHWGRRWPPFGEGYGFNSYVLEKNGRRMLLACDSAQTDLFASLASTPPDVAAFSIGAYDPWIYNHANPEQVWAMFQQTRARYLIPIHWGTFRLSKEPMQEPLQRLIAAAGIQQDRIVIRQIGGTWTLPASIEASQAAGR